MGSPGAVGGFRLDCPSGHAEPIVVFVAFAGRERAATLCRGA